MEYQGYLISHGGKVRDINQDNYYLNGFYRKNDDCFTSLQKIMSQDKILAAVFDGMGGEKNGEIASRIAAEYMEQKEEQILISGDITLFVEEVNKSIIAYDPQTMMGTTYVAAQVTNDKMIISNIGDSRGYLWRKGILKKITKDHTVLQEMLDNGIFLSKQVVDHTSKHLLSQCLGMQDEGIEIIPEPYISNVIELKQGDICLLCSDGLTDMVTDQKIQNILNDYKDIEEAGEMLLGYALTEGGKDNITILLIKVNENR